MWGNARTVRVFLVLGLLAVLIACGGGKKLRLEVQRETVIHDPTIESLSTEPSGRLDTREMGQTIAVRMVGDEGLQATFDVLGRFEGREMKESAPGVYTGSFQIPRGETGDLRIVGHLLHPPTGASADRAGSAALTLFRSPKPEPTGCTETAAREFDSKLQQLTVYFEFDDPELREAGKRKLANGAAVLNSNELCRIYVFGHTDQTGPASYNQVLSAVRAINVGRHLESLGVSVQRLEKHPLGMGFPAETDDTDEARAKNRRVELRAVDPYR